MRDPIPQMLNQLWPRPPVAQWYSSAAMTNVPLLDLKAQFAQIRAEVMPVIDQVCASQHFILGEHVRALEEEIARYCGASAGIGVSSGTDALLLALMALGIGAGDEVITSPFTFFATAGTIARTGARPVFCDIDPADLQSVAGRGRRPSSMSTAWCRAGELVHRATGGRIKALMPVHLYGQAADMDPLDGDRAPARLEGHRGCRPGHRHGIPNGARAGTIGDVGCFSFFPSKNLGAFGDAGLVHHQRCRISPSACGCCGCTAANRSIFMR